MRRAPAFRDPPSPAVRAAELELEIAKILVRAPRLPTPVPAFGLTLLAVSVEHGEVRLHFGRDGERLVTLLLDWPEGAAALRARPRWDGPRRPADDQRTLPLIEARLRQGIDRARWDAARAVAEELADLPRHVPLDAFRQLVPGSGEGEGLVRTGFHCNQDCGLCWQGRAWGRFPASQILTWIEDLRAAGARKLVISGGEPTLDASLPAYVARARELGFGHVCVETNAIQAAKPGYAERLREAGLDSAFVSLHSGDPEVSDRVTRAPGTHRRTVRGVQALLEADVTVRLNAVITKETLPTLPELPRFIREAFGDHPRLEALVVSDLGSTYEEAVRPSLVPDPAETRAALARFIDRAVEARLHVTGLGDPCGPPACMFGADRRVWSPVTVSGPLPFRRYAAACAGCDARHACFGVRESHVELFGESAVQPVRLRLSNVR